MPKSTCITLLALALLPEATRVRVLLTRVALPFALAALIRSVVVAGAILLIVVAA